MWGITLFCNRHKAVARQFQLEGVKDGERGEDNHKMAFSTKVLAMIDVNISGAFRALLMMKIDFSLMRNFVRV